MGDPAAKLGLGAAAVAVELGVPVFVVEQLATTRPLLPKTMRVRDGEFWVQREHLNIWRERLAERRGLPGEGADDS